MDLINFYKFFNNMYFTHVILSLGSNVGKYSQNEEWVQRTTLEPEYHVKKKIGINILVIVVFKFHEDEF